MLVHMDKSPGQTMAYERLPGSRTPASARTRSRLMTAAAELIAEVGWGRVTTRAVAERAGLPHGSVSYHFRGKQELLIEAVLTAFQDDVPTDQVAAADSLDDLVTLISAKLGEPEALESVLARLMLEAMREAERDPALRDRMGALLADYRRIVVATVRTDQQRGAVVDGVPAEAVATFLAALGDGLLLHALLDRKLDVTAALEAVRIMLRPT